MDYHKVLKWLAVRFLFTSLAVALMASALYVAEFCFWVADPQRKLPPRNRYASGIRYNWGQPIHNNRLGFRSREVRPKRKGVIRVMALGDSITWGAGIAVEQRYTNIVEERLNSDFGAGHVEVHNFAVSGGPLVQYAQILERYIGVVEPDLIIVGFCYNDADIKGGAWSPEKQRFDEKYGPGLVRLKGCLEKLRLPHIGVRAEETIRKTAELCGVYPDWITAIDRTYDPTSTQWQAFVRALAQIKRISDTRGLPAPIFASLNHGIHLRKPTDYAKPDPLVSKFLQWHHQAQAVAQAYGYVVVDFHQEIAEQMNGRFLVLNPLDNHPSPALNRLYADTLYPTVLETVGQIAGSSSESEADSSEKRASVDLEARIMRTRRTRISKPVFIMVNGADMTESRVRVCR
jgi:lysophospholipase L1-like esterase